MYVYVNIRASGPFSMFRKYLKTLFKGCESPKKLGEWYVIS